MSEPSQAQVLTDFVVGPEYVFRSRDGETAFASAAVGDHQETWPVRSKGFRRWLNRKFYDVEDKPPSAQAMSDALGAIEARAQFSGHIHDIHVRVARCDDAIYIDLADDQWRAVEITKAGWRLVSDPPVKFRRAKGMCPLQAPVPGGSLQELRPFLNLDDDGWILYASWLAQAARPVGPYPVCIFSRQSRESNETEDYADERRLS
jgi:hypothetical protein